MVPPNHPYNYLACVRGFFRTPLPHAWCPGSQGWVSSPGEASFRVARDPGWCIFLYWRNPESSKSQDSFCGAWFLSWRCCSHMRGLWEKNGWHKWSTGCLGSQEWESLLSFVCLVRGSQSRKSERKWIILFQPLIWVFPKIGVPQNGWFIMENHIKSGWFGGKTHYFRKHPFSGTLVVSFKVKPVKL